MNPALLLQNVDTESTPINIGPTTTDKSYMANLYIGDQLTLDMDDFCHYDPEEIT